MCIRDRYTYIISISYLLDELLPRSEEFEEELLRLLLPEEELEAEEPRLDCPLDTELLRVLLRVVLRLEFELLLLGDVVVRLVEELLLRLLLPEFVLLFTGVLLPELLFSLRLLDEFSRLDDDEEVLLGRVVVVLGRVDTLGRVVVVPGLELGLVLVFGRIFTEPKSERRFV